MNATLTVFNGVPDCKRTSKSRTGPKCRILVADDLRDSVDSLATMLRLAGHSTQTAHDGLEG